ncbi:hypothetical protein ACH5RR_029540 [Cinchona calisaya]|uniref:DUF7894 domain-containing protein n=1 Tax=Cinchona calisaya TaxID=153742 RepID=A0ABD2YTI5_9GENT
MKTATKLILLFKDGVSSGEGFASLISKSLLPNTNSNLRRLEDSFELSLDKYGINDHKASGNLIHFLGNNGVYEVSILLLEYYETPILACALNELLALLVGENPNIPTFVVPFLVEASKLKLENKNSITTYDVSLYGLEFGPVNTSTQALGSKTQRPPKSLRIYDEQLACLVRVVGVLDIPTFVLVGQHARHISPNTLNEDLEVIYEMGHHLANYSSLSFKKERIVWNPPMSLRIREEPWRALYG